MTEHMHTHTHTVYGYRSNVLSDCVLFQYMATLKGDLCENILHGRHCSCNEGVVCVQSHMYGVFFSWGLGAGH